MTVKYFYVRNDSNKREITVATRLTKKRKGAKIECAWTFRSNHDNFIKREGREISFFRLEDKDPKYSFDFFIDDPKYFDVLIKILEEIKTRDSTPKKYIGDIVWDIYYYQMKIADKMRNNFLNNR